MPSAKLPLVPPPLSPVLAETPVTVPKLAQTTEPSWATDCTPWMPLQFPATRRCTWAASMSAVPTLPSTMLVAVTELASAAADPQA